MDNLPCANKETVTYNSDNEIKNNLAIDLYEVKDMTSPDSMKGEIKFGRNCVAKQTN